METFVSVMLKMCVFGLFAAQALHARLMLKSPLPIVPANAPELAFGSKGKCPDSVCCVPSLDRLGELFGESSIGAVNFKVLEEGTGRVANWVHHRSVEAYADAEFDTYEITEGAVAFRRSILQRVGGYPATFFLSHEGPDLAFRIMNHGARVIYSPAVSVTHSFAPEGRPSWRSA